jgi:hypothetical protein
MVFIGLPFFAVAWLLIGFASTYRSVKRKEYDELLVAAGFVLWGFCTPSEVTSPKRDLEEEI